MFHLSENVPGGDELAGATKNLLRSGKTSLSGPMMDRLWARLASVIVDAAEAELALGVTEYDGRVNLYFTEGLRTNPRPANRFPWSGAFVMYCLRQAGLNEVIGNLRIVGPLDAADFGQYSNSISGTTNFGGMTLRDELRSSELPDTFKGRSLEGLHTDFFSRRRCRFFGEMARADEDIVPCVGDIVSVGHRDLGHTLGIVTATEPEDRAGTPGMRVAVIHGAAPGNRSTSVGPVWGVGVTRGTYSLGGKADGDYDPTIRMVVRPSVWDFVRDLPVKKKR